MQDIRSTIPASNYGVGRSAPIDTIVFHHIVGDAAAAITEERKPSRQMSSTYIIGSKGDVYYAVSESNTPYTNGNYSENTRSITIEHAGGHANVPYTEAMYKASVALVRDIRKRHNIKRFLRHRDIVATACPGGLDVERIIRESGTPVPLGGTQVEQVKSWYRQWLRREADANGLKHHVNNKSDELGFARGARVELHATIDALNKQLTQVKTALANEQKKPPKEVVKTVEKIVEKEVVKEVPVYVQDEETRQRIKTIYDYFTARWATFRDFLKK